MIATGLNSIISGKLDYFAVKTQQCCTRPSVSKRSRPMKSYAVMIRIMVVANHKKRVHEA